MDTLVSLGILGACGWSAYAMFVLDRGRVVQQGTYAELAAASGPFSAMLARQLA